MGDGLGAALRGIIIKSQTEGSTSERLLCDQAEG